MTTPFDIAKHINEKTSLEFDMKEFKPFMMNRIYSNTMDTVFFAEMMDQYNQLTPEQQYDFYYYGLPKSKRFGKWNKQSATDELVEMIMNKYECSRRIAESYLKIMTPSHKDVLTQQMDEGGKCGVRK